MGVFEKPKGSGIWWCLYYLQGKRHREKVGRKSDAQTLYKKRKIEALTAEKLPELRRKKVLLSELIDDALEYARANSRDVRNYVSKAEIVRSALGESEAATLTPQEIGRWLTRHCKTSATHNRYKAFISLCYREGIANRKVQTNPARSVRQRTESNGRLRFLSHEEAAALGEVIQRRFPEHHDSYLVALHTGMRLGEQFTTQWPQVKFERRVIELSRTKNGSARSVQLNSIALDALLRQKATADSKQSLAFPGNTKGGRVDTRTWFTPCLKEAGIVDFTWHGLRHTFCSWLAMAGVSLKSIQELAGHKTISMSARYSHLSPDHKLSEVERIAVIPRSKLSEMPKRTA